MNSEYLFVHIPKCAGTQLETLFKSYGHRSLIEVQRNYGLKKFNTFTIVRNPYDRFISAY